jgi:hypothetical protein
MPILLMKEWNWRGVAELVGDELGGHSRVHTTGQETCVRSHFTPPDSLGWTQALWWKQRQGSQSLLVKTPNKTKTHLPQTLCTQCVREHRQAVVLFVVLQLFLVHVTLVTRTYPVYSPLFTTAAFPVTCLKLTSAHSLSTNGTHMCPTFTLEEGRRVRSLSGIVQAG